MLSELGHAYRTVRFRLWAASTRQRLRRHGGDLVLRMAATPRFQTVPRVELNGFGGSLELTIGADCRIGRDMVIELRPGKHGTIEFGDRVTIQNNVRFQVWGGAVRLADDCQIRDLVELQSLGELTMGWKTLIGRMCHIHCDERITLGERVGLAERTTVIDSDHGFTGDDTWFMDTPIRVSPVEIGDNTFTSANTMVLRGTRIGPNSCTGAGAVLLGGDFPEGHLIVGAPAKAVKDLRAT